MNGHIHRGEIYYVMPTYAVGSEQRAGRPGIIVSNNLNNRYSPTVEVVLLTTNMKKRPLPTHVLINSAKYPSIALCEQIMTVSVERLGSYMGELTDDEMEALDEAMMASLDLKRERFNDATLCVKRRAGSHYVFPDRKYAENMY